LNKKILIPVITAVLLAFGINLDKLGIDLNALLDGDLQSATSGGNSNGELTLKEFGKSNADSGKAAGSSNTAGYQSGAKWSKTSPAINLHHVFEGEINRKGRPVGFHSRPGGVDPSTARLVRIRDKPNNQGVYTAMIEVRDGSRWLEKFSSFFPDSMSAEQVTDAVLNAYRNSKNKKSQPWRGPSGLGFDIEGYTLSKGDINTAYPIYK
jgi:hypothetical protein